MSKTFREQVEMLFVQRFMKSLSVGCTLANSSDRLILAKIEEPEISFLSVPGAIGGLLFPGVDMMRTLGERNCPQT